MVPKGNVNPVIRKTIRQTLLTELRTDFLMIAPSYNVELWSTSPRDPWLSVTVLQQVWLCLGTEKKAPKGLAPSEAS